MSDAGLPLVLDLFSGTGSATQPFVECGKHRVVRIDMNPSSPADYHRDLSKIPRNFAWEDITQGDPVSFVWASPPCDDLTDVPWHVDKRVPEDGAWLFRTTFDHIRYLYPPLFCVENVRGAQRFVGKADYHRGSRYLWTNIPLLPKVRAYGKWRLPPSADRKILRSMIPAPLAEAVHRAVCEGP